MKSGKFSLSGKTTKFLTFTYSQMERRKDICQILGKSQADRFFRQIVTTGEKWTYLSNCDKSGPWIDRGSRPKPHSKRDQFKKGNVDVLWNYEGVILFDVVVYVQAVNSQYYLELLE